MLIGVLVSLYSIILAVLSMIWICRRYNKDSLVCFKSIKKSKIVCLVLTAIALTIILTVQCMCIYGKESLFVVSVIKWSTLFWGCYLLAWIDYKERIIPNKIILGLCILRIIFLLYELITNLESWKQVIIYPVIGAGAGALVMGTAMLISGRSIGMGDVKLFLTIGAYVGSTEIFSVMLCSFLASAVAGISLLILKKAKFKDSIPMAPFVFIGIAFEYILLMLEGDLV